MNFPNFVGINEKFLNLNSIALVEDKTDASGSVALITTIEGTEIELTGTDADLVFERVELFAAATDELTKRLQNVGVTS